MKYFVKLWYLFFSHPDGIPVFSLFWQIILLCIYHVKNKHKSIKHVITVILTKIISTYPFLKCYKKERAIHVCQYQCTILPGIKGIVSTILIFRNLFTLLSSRKWLPGNGETKGPERKTNNWKDKRALQRTEGKCALHRIDGRYDICVLTSVSGVVPSLLPRKQD